MDFFPDFKNTWTVLKYQNCHKKEHFVFFYFLISEIKNTWCSLFRQMAKLRTPGVTQANIISTKRSHKNEGHFVSHHHLRWK